MSPPKKGPATSEASRLALDVLAKWQKAVPERWAIIYGELTNVGVKIQPVLKVGTHVTIDADRGTMLVKTKRAAIGVGNDRSLVSLVEAIEEGDLDVGDLPALRENIRQLFKGFEKQIQDVKNAAAHAESEKNRKIKEVLPTIIDEFGADIMTYRNPKNPNDNVKAGGR